MQIRFNSEDVIKNVQDFGGSGFVRNEIAWIRNRIDSVDSIYVCLPSVSSKFTASEFLSRRLAVWNQVF